MPEVALLILLVALMVLAVVALRLALAEPPTPEPEKPATFDSLGLPSATTHRRAVSVPVPAPDKIADDRTRPIRTRVTYAEFQPYEEQPPPWSAPTYLHAEEGGKHRAPESLCRVTGFTGELPRVDAPRADWSGHWSTDPTVLMQPQDGAR